MAENAQRTQMKIRLPVELHEFLEQEAANHGRSLNAEIVSRLADSRQDRPDETALNAVVTAVSLAMQEAGQIATALDRTNAGQAWIDSPFGYDQAVRAAVAVLDAFRPAGEIPQPPQIEGLPSLHDLGRGAAAVVLGCIIGQGVRKERPEEAAVRSHLNDDLRQRIAAALSD